jgi:hypothetical protein
VGPSLGAENIQKGFDSVLYGFIVLSVFICVYYGLMGIISTISLVVNLLLLVAILSMLQATLTLPGIAAVALTLGMAIDANVLINERIRDQGRLRAGLGHHSRLQRHDAHRRPCAAHFRQRSGARLRGRPLSGNTDVDVLRGFRLTRAGGTRLRRPEETRQDFDRSGLETECCQDGGPMTQSTERSALGRKLRR